MYRVLLVLLILELKIIFRTSSKFVNQNTLTYTLHGTFSIFCDVPWNFVEFRMSRKSLGWAAKISGEISFKISFKISSKLWQ